MSGPLHRPVPAGPLPRTTGEVSAWLRPYRRRAGVTLPVRRHLRVPRHRRPDRATFGLYRWTFGPDESGPEPHFHRAITESFYVLSGEVRLYDGTGWTDRRPGDFLFVPEGGLHGFRAATDASMLLMFAPGAPREDYFETLAGLAEHPMTEEERTEFMLRHDTYWV